MDKVLVTGGAGFLGSHLVDKLIEKDIKVKVFDNFFRGKRENIKHQIKNENFDFILGDIRNFAIVKKAVRDVETIFHLAAINGTKYFYEKPLDILEVNALGTENMLKASVEGNVERFVFASTSEVYGHPQNFPTSEQEPINFKPPLSSRWSYAVSKLYDEHLCQAYSRKFGLKTVILRYFNAYGPRLIGTPYGQVVSIFVKNVLEGKPPKIYGDGTQTRSFMYVSDSIEGTIASAEKRDAAGQVFNIGYDKETTINELAELIINLCGKHSQIKPIYVKPLPDEPRRRQPDISKAMKILNFKPRVNLEEGLQRTIEWFRGRL